MNKIINNKEGRMIACLIVLSFIMFIATAGARHARTRAAKTIRGAPKITYPSNSASVGAYFCKPHGQGPFPAVIYNHGGKDNEIGGAPEKTCLTLAQAGFIGLSPLYRPRISFDGYIGDIFSAIKYLQGLPEVDAKRLGIIGFSRGGAATLGTALYRPYDFKAIVLMAPAPGPNNILSSYLPSVNKIGAPVLLQVAENDVAAPANHLQRARATLQALKDANKDARLIVYPPYGQDGHKMFFAVGAYWKDTLAFLQANLSPPPSQPKTETATSAVYNLTKTVKAEIEHIQKSGSYLAEGHYHELKKKLDYLTNQGVEGLASYYQIIEERNPLAIAKRDRAREIAGEERKRKQQLIEEKGPFAGEQPGCRTDPPVFTHDFTDITQVQQITAPGSPSHEGPKGHSFVWTGGALVEVKAPTDLVLDNGVYGTQGGRHEYGVTFRVKGSCNYMVRFGHIHDVVDSIKAALPQTPKAEGDSRGEPATALVEIKAGEVIGRTRGNPKSNNWDIGVYDMVKAGSLAAHGCYGMHCNGLCWVDLYTAEKRTQYQRLLTGPRIVCAY